jgi:hypothetical protein
MLNYSLAVQGKFRARTFNRNGELIHDTDYFDNFITQTGLMYPYTFSFADCFRYLSLGSGTAVNSVIGNGTTGLSLPLPRFTYIGGQTGYVLEGCGYRELSSGVELFREWRVPPTDGLFEAPYVFKELMLSPSLPSVEEQCSQNDGGNEENIFADTYSNPCDMGKLAFTRVIRNIAVEADSYLHLSYVLTIVVPTGRSLVKIPISTIGSVGANTSWDAGFSGYFSLIHNGVKLVRDNYRAIPDNISQIRPNQDDIAVGESFVGPYGCPLEPHTFPDGIEYRVFTLHTDGTQFLVNATGGGAVNVDEEFPFSSGNMVYFPYAVEDYYLVRNSEVPAFIENIREAGGDFPNPEDYTQVINKSSSQAMTSKASNTVTYATGTSTQRSKSRRMYVQWPNTVNNLMYNSGVRALVGSFKSLETNVYYPFFDMALMTRDDVNGGRKPFDVNLVDTNANTFEGVNHYPYRDDRNNLRLTFDLSWTSPCGPGVAGC